MKHARFDAEGRPLAFFEDTVTPNIPADAVPLSDTQWRRFIDNAGHCLWQNGDAIVTALAAPIDPVPDTISPRQFYEQCAVQGLISQDEALSALRGIVPPPLESLIATLPEAQRFPARMKILGATHFLLTDPLSLAIAQVLHWSTDQLDTFWRDASLL